MQIINDRSITVSTGTGRKCTNWQPAVMTLGELYDRLRTPIRGEETFAAYMKMSKTERDNRKKDAAAVKLRSTVDTFLSGKHFVNDITRESITDKLVTALGSDDARGKSINDLFTGLVTDQNGKEIPGILVADPASKARFSSDHSGMVPPAGGAKEYVAQKYKNNPFFRG